MADQPRAEEPLYDPNVPLGQVNEFGPPIGGVAPPLQCNRIVHGDLAGRGYCGREATWHIMWTADMENGLACDEHAQEARELWVFYAIHEYESACSMADMGAMYFHDINRCLLPGDLREIKAAAEKEVEVDA